MSAAAPAPRVSKGQAATGLVLAFAILSAWVAVHLYCVFGHRWTLFGTLIAPALIALQCWLNVGLFIVAHDAMHGSLVPFRPAVNRAIGRTCLFLYAGFSFDALIGKHMDHHRHSGSALDPDFNDADPDRFWRWFAVFLRRYFGWPSAIYIAALAVIYLVILRADPANVLVLWALPAILSAVQLFFFGTFLPHRHDDHAFADDHNSRSSEFGWLVSLLTCFHFGYHHEHHLAPHVPWWGLPRARSRLRAKAAETPGSTKPLPA